MRIVERERGGSRSVRKEVWLSWEQKSAGLRSF